VSTSTDHGTLSFEQRISFLFRLMCLVGGLFALVVPAWQLRWGLTSLNWCLPLILFIVVGSMMVGAVFVAAAVAGDDVRWRIAHGRLALYRRSWLRERTDLITSGDVCRTSVEVETWDSDPDTYRVGLELWNGERHQTPDFATRAEAVSAEQKIRNLLCLPWYCRDSSAL
jgi:hypothetical protein